MSRSDFEDFSGKWKKMNHSGYEVICHQWRQRVVNEIIDAREQCNISQEFIAKNPGLASNKDDIVLDYTLADDGFTCVVHIDGAHAVTANYKYSGVAENKLGEVKYTIETSVGSVSTEQILV